MNNTDPANEPLSDLDRATQARLRQLSAMPVELGALKASIERQIPRPANGLQNRFHIGRFHIGRFHIGRFRFRPLQAVAAGIGLIGLTVVLFLATASKPVLASADDLAALHKNPVHLVMPADSMRKAQELLATQLPREPQLPQAPSNCVKACCVRNIGNKAIACVRMEVDATPVTLALARARDIKCRPANTVERNGVRYGVQTADGTQILTTQRDGQWVVLISTLPIERLLDVAEMLKF